METFSASDVVIYTGVTIPVLEHWIARKWVVPSIGKSADGASDVLFNRTDLYHISFLKKVKASGFSLELAAEKINVYPICENMDRTGSTQPVGIAFSRVMDGDACRVQGAWILSTALDKETGWDSYGLIERRLAEGATDFYIVNFSQLKSDIDAMIAQARGG